MCVFLFLETCKASSSARVTDLAKRASRLGSVGKQTSQDSNKAASKERLTLKFSLQKASHLASNGAVDKVV